MRNRIGAGDFFVGIKKPKVPIRLQHAEARSTIYQTHLIFKPDYPQQKKSQKVIMITRVNYRPCLANCNP